MYVICIWMISSSVCKLIQTNKASNSFCFEKKERQGTWLGESLDNNLTGRGEVLHLKTTLIYMYLGLKWADNISMIFFIFHYVEKKVNVRSSNVFWEVPWV